MEYLLSALEGIITFISPCLLPMIPVYVIYFSGENGQSTKSVLKSALGFVAGFTLIFTAMGAFAGAMGSFLVKYRTETNIVTGAIVVLFGLNYLGVFGKGFFRRGTEQKPISRRNGFFGSLLFGMIFSVGWTPCVGAFLGSALMLASGSGTVLEGMLMLLCYSLGLGIPFILSALLIDGLKGAFGFIKRHYRVINIVCGSLLIVIGVLMMTGVMSRLTSLVSSF